MIRKLVILGTVAGVALVGSGIAIERIAEPHLEEAAADALGLQGGITVDIESFPLVLDVLQGRVDAINVGVGERRFEDLVVRDLQATLEGIEIEGSLLGGGPEAIRVERVTVSASTDEEAINAFLRRRGRDARVRLLDDEVEVIARRSVLGSTRTFRARGPLILEGNELVFRPTEVSWDGPSFPGAEEAARRATTVRERLPQLPAEVRISSIEVSPGEVRLLANGEGRRFPLR